MAWSDLHFEKDTLAAVWETNWRDARINGGNNRTKKRKIHRPGSGGVPTFNGWGVKDKPINFFQEVALRGGERKISS